MKTHAISRHTLPRLALVGMFGCGLAGIAGAQADSDMGSPASSADLFTKDYAQALQAALPRIERAKLQHSLEQFQHSHPAGFDPLKLKARPDVEKLFGLKPAAPAAGKDFVAGEELAYRIDRVAGRVLFARALAKIEPVPFAEAERSRERIGREHLELLAKVGIDAPQILFQHTVVTSLRTEGPNADAQGQGEPVVDSVFTYALRGVDGIQVEGSEARLASNAPGQVVSLNVRWPGVMLHPGLKSPVLKDVKSLEPQLLPRIKQAAGGAEANVRMAVVLRPVRAGGRRVFVPALKVGVLPKNDEGEVFYLDLSQQKLVYDEGQRNDTAGSGATATPVKPRATGVVR